MHEFYTIRNAAKVLNHPVRTVRYWVVTGKIKAVKDLNGRRWLIPISEIKRLMGEDCAYVDEHTEYSE